jgi:hypothetical protein
MTLMGIVVNYKCGNCNYSKGLWVGCGLRDKRTWIPALDKTLKEIVPVNVSEPIPDEENIVLYSDLTLNGKPFFRLTPSGIEWGRHILLRRYNYCPKCGKYKLSCEEDGLLWD